jgi:drug/metabolite transporter (DMT)-like permease
MPALRLSAALSKCSPNLTGILAMTGAMLAFAANDTCVKLIGEHFPLSQIIAFRNGIATVLIVIAALWTDAIRWPQHPHLRPAAWRVISDVLATWCLVAAIIALPIADATALSQFAPVALTIAAALVLREPVGWRRWSAVIAGLAGVMLIVRPGTAAFAPAAVLALGGVVFMVVRDLTTRAIGTAVPALMLAGLSTGAGSLTGALLAAYDVWIWPTGRDFLLLSASGIFLVFAYLLIIVAMRHGDVATVSPFRYTVILFAIIPGWLIWDQTPDGLQWLGIMLLTAAGLYTLYRERSAAVRRGAAI